eukprot:scaffold150834_cov32-Tisochrysis_lutea.AAC.1
MRENLLPTCEAPSQSDRHLIRFGASAREEKPAQIAGEDLCHQLCEPAAHLRYAHSRVNVRKMVELRDHRLLHGRRDCVAQLRRKGRRPRRAPSVAARPPPHPCPSSPSHVWPAQRAARPAPMICRSSGREKPASRRTGWDEHEEPAERGHRPHGEH